MQKNDSFRICCAFGGWKQEGHRCEWADIHDPHIMRPVYEVRVNNARKQNTGVQFVGFNGMLSLVCLSLDFDEIAILWSLHSPCTSNEKVNAKTKSTRTCAFVFVATGCSPCCKLCTRNRSISNFQLFFSDNHKIPIMQSMVIVFINICCNYIHFSLTCNRNY